MELRTLRHRIQVEIRSSRSRGTLLDFRRREWKPHAQGAFNTASTASPIAGDARLDLIAPDVVVLLRRSWIFGGENFLFHKYCRVPVSTRTEYVGALSDGFHVQSAKLHIRGRTSCRETGSFKNVEREQNRGFRIAFCLPVTLRANLQSHLKYNAPVYPIAPIAGVLRNPGRRDARPSMISRIRCIITALFLCQLLLGPGVVTIQAHAAQMPASTSSQMGGQAVSSGSGTSFDNSQSAASDVCVVNRSFRSVK